MCNLLPKLLTGSAIEFLFRLPSAIGSVRRVITPMRPIGGPLLCPSLLLLLLKCRVVRCFRFLTIRLQTLQTLVLQCPRLKNVRYGLGAMQLATPSILSLMVDISIPIRPGPLLPPASVPTPMANGRPGCTPVGALSVRLR